MFTTIYEQDSFEPVARLVCLKDALLKAANDEIKNAERESWEDEPTLIPSMQVYHYHNDHLGTPNELTSQDGEVVWLADYQAWGNTAQVVWREHAIKQLQVNVIRTDIGYKEELNQSAPFFVGLVKRLESDCMGCSKKIWDSVSV